MMRGQPLNVHDVDVGLGELAVAPLLRPLTSPHLLDLITPEREGQLVSVLQHVTGEWHREVEVQTKISWAVLTMQPLYGVDLFVDLALFGQAIQRLDRARLDRGESVQLKGLAQPVEHELFDDPGFRDVLRKTGQRLRATHATPCCQPAAARPEGCQAGRGAAGGLSGRPRRGRRGSSARSCKYGLPTRSRAIVVC